MILYHGSNVSIDKIDLSKSKTGKDFGCGFYLSADESQALRMAEKKTAIAGYGVPTVNKYEFDTMVLNSNELNVQKFDSYNREWAEFILMNRKNRDKSLCHPYDIVIGPIADDTVGFQIRRYIEGIITIEQFIDELRYMHGVTMQYFFGTPKAIDYLTKIEAI